MTDEEARLFLESRGWGCLPPGQHRSDLEQPFLDLWKQVEPYTMTSPERGYALYQAVRYVAAKGVEGDFVECGVWRGGSCMLMHLTAEDANIAPRVHLYDTFSGMSEPTDEDVIAWNGIPVRQKWDEDKAGIKDNFGSWAVGIDAVRQNLSSVGAVGDRFVYHPGDVAETLRSDLPDRLAILRLDTDWYESTKVELEVLYPRLVPGGVLIIDDYGYFTGARKAVDEYFENDPLYLTRVDFTGRVAVKPG